MLKWPRIGIMNRRNLLLSSVALAISPTAHAADQPWSARLLRGGFDGKVWWSGLSISLQPEWKTYWRVPGDGGIAPSLEVTGDNIAATRIHYPIPGRFSDETGKTIGYKEEVVFPISMAPTDGAKPMAMSFKSFFGVCHDVCIPAQLDTELLFDGTRGDAPDQAVIAQWLAKVPEPVADGPIRKVTVEMREGQPVLMFDTDEAIWDIFVEGNPNHYFGNPMIMRGLITMPVNGVKSLDELRATPLRITLQTRWKALEQVVTVV
jgi:DsbC/DsbD-like thiol-disulfide interchange protein